MNFCGAKHFNEKKSTRDWDQGEKFIFNAGKRRNIYLLLGDVLKFFLLIALCLSHLPCPILWHFYFRSNAPTSPPLHSKHFTCRHIIPRSWTSVDPWATYSGSQVQFMPNILEIERWIVYRAFEIFSCCRNELCTVKCSVSAQIKCTLAVVTRRPRFGSHPLPIQKLEALLGNFQWETRAHSGSRHRLTPYVCELQLPNQKTVRAETRATGRNH